MEAGVLIILAYLMPAIIAVARKHRNAPAIAVLCLLLGWSGIGWVVCLVWAFTCNTKDA